MSNRLMTFDLFDTLDVVDDDVAAVVDAYMADPRSGFRHKQDNLMNGSYAWFVTGALIVVGILGTIAYFIAARHD